MKNTIFRSTSIAELHQGMGLGEPRHPLVSIIDTADLSYGEELIGMRFCSDMYCISMKDKECGIDYGLNSYDSSNGSLIFTAPEQVSSVKRAQQRNEVNGWMLYFHPDLFQNTSLGSKIDHYSFFNYELHDALYLSEEEQQTLNQLVVMIQKEIDEQQDDHSQQLIVSYIELILNYCVRFYERQVKANPILSADIVSRVEALLKDYYKNGNPVEEGPPTLQYLADKCHLSPNYLSALLAKETGRSAKDHINDFLVEKAKNLLLTSSDSVSGIAYSLGFNYPHYFARIFKKKTGKTPQEYRKSL